jgi:activator of 2-hydroxyglutaryl-CoA dehydratase/predicted nucleotide-binding protein (sugar kinase/HSP70/actin superfamily)
MRPDAEGRSEPDRVIIDAGVENIRVRLYGESGTPLKNLTIPSNTRLRREFEKHQLIRQKGTLSHPPTTTYITGKLADVIRDALGHGEIILPAAALWSGLQSLLQQKENDGVDSLAAIDLSASGYLIIGIDSEGQLKDDLLIVNPRCGAGSGVNIDRVLQKLAIARKNVDSLLKDYLGEPGRATRAKINVRADRCGVFSSSATISDKNQGIPLEFALAVTLKSEVMKTCKKLPAGFDKVYLTGGIFKWQFARDCAADHLESIGVLKVEYDAGHSLPFDGIVNLVDTIGKDNYIRQERRLKRRRKLAEFPAFGEIKRKYEAENLYRRLPDETTPTIKPDELESRPIVIGLDAGSTMAKLVIADAENRDILFLGSYSNCGDTIETIKEIFRDLQSRGIRQLTIKHIGITGSARYQVQEALRQVYPRLAACVSVLVENYAHARGSIEHARAHIRHLKEQGIEDINEDFLILVDIGGEDTKLSTVSLKKGELFDNAMNVKCSAGTGSLMDSLTSMFGIESVSDAAGRAFQAGSAHAINATCAVFLMENARKFQARGYPEGEILASANWAIVENMARTLWSQVDLPKRAVVALHGQTMLSEPLPLAVTHRLQEHLGAPAYGIVPPNPGHMACLGLIKTFAKNGKASEACLLDDFISREFTKKIIVCRGAACGDREARCNRISMSGKDACGKRFNFSLGGCTAINDLLAQKQSGLKPAPAPNTYQEIWSFIDDRLPRSEDQNRLVIPRSFSVSEWAGFFAHMFGQLGLPVHVDNVQESDIIAAQPFFNIDSCAPQIGAVGQFCRLAGEAHGMILAPQIEYLPVRDSEGRTCTINQGGVVVAKNLAEVTHPDARFHLFNVDLKQLEPGHIAHQLHGRLEPVFHYYGIKPGIRRLRQAVDYALEAHSRLKADMEDRAADIVEKALLEGRRLALVAGREYILNPGIYDSHVGRLLRDKNIAALPLYALNAEPDTDFAHIYWRNPYHIVSALNAISQKKLHQRLSHPRLKALFRQIETDASTGLLPVVQVSTFRCGPDSVTAPVVAEIMKKRPFLLIQSDAAIKELAHLENRVNTYVKQLDLGLHGEIAGAGSEPFEIRILDRFNNDGDLNKETDVIYFPTISDNRSVSSVMRGAGFTCIDNYDDETFDLADIVRKGRKIAGDSVCAPLAAVYGDVLRAIEDFSGRKQADDPLVAGKHRILIFNNKGLGPCRQGQYAEVHKLFLHQSSGTCTPESDCRQSRQSDLPQDAVLQFLIAAEHDGFNFGIEEWVVIRAFQGVILQGILHSLLFKGGSQCRNYNEYLEFQAAFRTLKQQIYRIQEKRLQPGKNSRKLVGTYGFWPGIGLGVKYLAYRLYARDLNRTLRIFADQWIEPGQEDISGRLKIYIEGEAYMRTAQAEEIFTLLLSSLGFRRFTLEYSPLWSYMAYLLDEGTINAREKLQVARERRREAGVEERNAYIGTITEEKRSLAKLNGVRLLLRDILARPLYKAARIAMPDPMSDTLKVAKEIVPTLRPYGELGPYAGKALVKLRQGYDLFLNVAPEGCMVSSMGEVLTPKILQSAGEGCGRIQNLFSSDGEIDEELLTLALLKALSPENYYRKKGDAG